MPILSWRTFIFMLAGIKKLLKKVVGYVKEFGKLTPIAFLTAVLPIFGSMSLILVSYPLGHWLRENWEIGLGLFFLGVLFFCGLSLLPTNVIGIISGWSFGFGFGIAILISGVVGAATISFIIHKRIVGDTLPHVFEKHPKAQAVYQALIGQSKWRATLIIFLLRLSPAMPFALTNFLMASAGVPIKSYIGGTFLGMLPRSTAVVFVGSGLSELSFNDPQEMWLIVFGIGATILSIIFIGIVARRALDHLTQSESRVESRESRVGLS